MCIRDSAEDAKAAGGEHRLGRRVRLELVEEGAEGRVKVESRYTCATAHRAMACAHGHESVHTERRWGIAMVWAQGAGGAASAEVPVQRKRGQAWPAAARRTSKASG
eukprot:3600708-Prymnesium_polylepis.1